MCVCVCVEERWFLHQLFLVISCWTYCLIKLWLEYGLSSSQIRTNGVRNVVLFVVDPSSIHHYIFWIWPMLSPCSHDGGSPVIWKFRWVVVEPIDNILISSMMLLNVKLVLETFEGIFFMLVHEVIVGWKEWLPLIHVHLVKVAAENLRKLVLLPLESSQVSHAFVRSILWFGRLITYTPYGPLAHQATNWFVQGEEVPS